MNPIELGKFIATLRNEKKLTQEELAEKLYIDKRKVSRWECGTSIPDFETLIKLSEILDVSLYELSICQRIKDESINSRILNKLKSIKDLKKLKLKKIIYISISILLGIFFALTTIYTIDYYGTVEIYKFESLNENYTIEGNYIHANNINVFNILKIGTIDNNKTILNEIDKYELFRGNERIIYANNNINNKINLSYNSKIMNNDYQIRSQDTLTIRFPILDDKSEEKYESFNFIIHKIYDNKFF